MCGRKDNKREGASNRQWELQTRASHLEDAHYLQHTVWKTPNIYFLLIKDFLGYIQYYIFLSLLYHPLYPFWLANVLN